MSDALIMDLKEKDI